MNAEPKPPAKFALRLPTEKRNPRDTAPPQQDAAAPWGETLPEGAFRDVLARRSIAFAIDLVVIGLLWLGFGGMAVLLGIFSLGLLWAPATFLLGLLPLLYSTFTIGAPALQGSLGMRLMGLRVASWRKGEPPGLLRAAIMSVVFYATAPATFGLVLAFGLFNTRKRLLHDALSDIILYCDESIDRNAA